MSILKQVTFDSASRRKDKSFRYSFVTTTEQTDGKDIANIFDLLDSSGTIYFKPDGLLTEEQAKAIDLVSKTIEPVKKSKLSQSQLLRLALEADFKAQKLNATKEEIEENYNVEMTKFINNVRNRKFE